MIDVNAAGIGGVAEAFQRAAALSPVAVARALNATNAKVQTQIVRALPKQTGLKAGRIRAALKREAASAGHLSAAVRARGPYIPLKEFGARETAKGVSAAPWGKRRVFAGAFSRGGRFPNRVALALGGHVFKRLGKKRLKIAITYGPAIPVEMVKDASKAAYEATVARELPIDLNRALGSVLRGF
ncbi:phage tail protein [Bosea sp. TWI1241]|uniref:phage tail protein n=1 Tax=Bosea sp. TWI1241 TaxID=3148904 RepID=UPI0032099A27